MSDNQQGQQQQQQQPGSQPQSQQHTQRQISQGAPSTNQNQQSQQQTNQQQQQPQAIQPQQQQQQTLQQQQQQALQQQQQQNVQQQAIQQMPQLQQDVYIQIAPQQTQQLLPNLQAHSITSVPLSMTMATNPMSCTMTGTNLRPQLGQLPQVQVIHQAMHSPSYIPQFTYSQQQLMLQNMQASMQANLMTMNPQINMANMVAMPARQNTNMFSPAAQNTATNSGNVMNMSSAAVSQITNTTTGSSNSGKGMSKQQQQSQNQQQQMHALGQVQQAQATAMIGGKPIILGSATGSLLQGPIGVISAGQLQTSQAYAAGPTFSQLQSKSGQQIGIATNQGQGQMISSQSPIRFSQPQMIASNAGAQLITSQPVFANQMLQAMASLQQYPQQPNMSSISGQGLSQNPTIIAGQGLYIRSANPVQTQNLMTSVQTPMNTNFKNSAQQSVQTVAMPIQKQTTAAQTGKVLLPSMSKTVTAKVQPNSASATAKNGVPPMQKPKGRPKGSGKSSPAVTSTAAIHGKSEAMLPNTAKTATPLGNTVLAGLHDTQNQSDSEIETASKSNNEHESQSNVDNNSSVGNKKESLVDDVFKENIIETVRRPGTLPVPLVEKQRAIVKPHILTHVIEGFVIQEGPVPFPVQRSSLLTEFIPPKPGQPVEQSSLISMDEEEMDQDDDNSAAEQGPMPDGKSLCCEYCNNTFSSQNPSQRFCSKSCAKRYNIGCSKRLQRFPGKPKEKGSGRIYKRKRKGKKVLQANRSQSLGSLGTSFEAEMEDQSSSVSQEETPSPSVSPDHNLLTPPTDLQVEGECIHPLSTVIKWNVQEVYEFVKAVTGCAMYADEFRAQEIDGQSLLLLKDDHLMTTMNMKLGPALKLSAQLDAIKQEKKEKKG